MDRDVKFSWRVAWPRAGPTRTSLPQSRAISVEARIDGFPERTLAAPTIQYVLTLT
jgi:hypothetical protein